MSSVDAESLIKKERKEKPFRLWLYIHEILIKSWTGLSMYGSRQKDKNHPGGDRNICITSFPSIHLSCYGKSECAEVFTNVHPHQCFTNFSSIYFYH